MQQLNQWAIEGGKITLTSPVPDDVEAFESFAAQFSSSDLWQTLSLETGADRAQLHFRFQHYDFLMHYEALCDALWIEPMNNQGTDKIRNLIIELD